MFKNVASQKLIVYAYDATTGAPKTGDAANLTAYVSKDFGAVTVLGDTSATEMDATNAKGSYLFDLTQGETNADCAHFTGKSSTANIYIAPQTIYTDPPNYTTLAIDSSGNGAADVKKLLGTAWLTPGTAGTPDVNTKLWNGLATVALPLIPTVAGRTLDCSAGGEAGVDWANVGSPTTAVDLSGTTIKTTQKVDVDTNKTQPVTCAAGVTVLASVGTAATSTAQTGDNFARLGAPAGASVSADIAAVKVDTAAVKTQTDKMTFTVANVMDSNMLRINGDAVAAADLAQSADTIVRGTCSGGTTTTAVVSTLVNPSSLTDAGQLIGRTIIFKGSTGTANVQGQASNITGSTTGATPTITFTAMTTAPANGDTFVVV